jgi:PAS domain S-box-containing protein
MTGSAQPPPFELAGPPVFLSTAPAGRGERRLALAVVLVSALIFLTAAPFAKVRLAPVSAFIPIYESILVVTDLITAVLLFGQFSFLRARALLVLASGYLFTALITVAHALTFPGLFAPTGLLGAGPQSTAWLYMFWHGGFPLLVIAYALLKDERGETSRPRGRARVPILASVGAIAIVVGGLSVLATAGQRVLPPIMRGNEYTPLLVVVIGSVWALSVLALAILWRRRPHSVLDLWLMVVMCAWLFDIALSAILNAGRFDLGFYAGRIYGLLAASFVLMALLIENGKLYAWLVEAHGRERRARQHVQASLRESEERTRLIVAHALDAVITMDVEGRITSWNPQAEAIFGWPADAVVGQRLSDTIVPPAHRAAHERGLAHFRQTGEGPVLNRRLELTALRRDGTEIPVELAITPMQVGGITVFSAFLRDITERRMAEQALATATERLNLLHEIDRAIIAATDPAAIAGAVLPRVQALLGVPRAIVNLFDLKAGTVEWLAAIGRRRLQIGPGVRFPLSLMGDVTALASGELQVVNTKALSPNPHTEALLASGVHTYMVVPMIAGGQLIGALSFGGTPSEFLPEQIEIAREVAAQLAIALAHARLHERVMRQAEELEERVQERTLELQQAQAEADRANQAKSDFLSRMSHELRTPLNAILGFGQLIEMRAETPQDRESVEQILKGGRHLLNLINEVLDISRVEAGGLSLSPEPVQVGDVVLRVVDLARPLASPRRITFQTEGLLTDRYVLADNQRLQQVLLNFVSNSIKYNHEGGRVTVACHEDGTGRLRISVTDTGPGIPAALQSRLFTPFDRLGADAHGIEGTGLGLALSKRLVEAMGGLIGLESAEGRGSTFWVELPETRSPALRAGLGEPTAPGGPAPMRRGTVLYVEDNPSNLRLVERVLAERPAVRLIPAMQGRLALAMAREHRPDLIFVDLHLPDISGEEVLRELHADPDLKDTPVIIVSADATPGQLKRLLAAGARAYLTKPLDVAELLGLLDATLSD